MKNKIIPLMIGTYMLLQPAAALAKRYDGPIREISVKVVYDEEYASKAKKRKHIAIVEKASKTLEEQVGIRLVIKGEGHWDSDDHQNNIHLSRREMEAEAGQGEYEILIGVTGQEYRETKRDRDGRLTEKVTYGVAEGLGFGNSVLICGDYNWPELLAEHEILHLFGAEHTNALFSVMNTEPSSKRIDKKNKEIILRKKNRWFK